MKHIKTGFLNDSHNTARIPVEELLIGMYVCQLDKPWQESNFLFQGFLIENQKILQQVSEQCHSVYIDINKQSITLPLATTQAIVKKVKKKSLKRILKTKTTVSPTTATVENKGPYRLKDIFNQQQDLTTIEPPPKTSTFEQELANAQQTHLRTSHIIKNFLHETSNGKAININIAKKAVYDCMHSILRTPDAMLLMTQLRHKDKHTWNHSMNVCILAISLGRHLNLRYDELITLGLCGMLHDMGKMRIPTEILNKTGSYSPEEKAFMESHTTLGKQILSATPNMTDIIAEVAYSHHERIDGQGYPRGLHEKQISPYTKIISVVDIYDALTTDRAFHNSRTHLDAINTMLEVSGTQIDEALVHSFIQCIGVYPAGCIVEMGNGDIAIVLETNSKKKLRPKVLIISDQFQIKKRSRIIDLATTQYDTKHKINYIKTILHPDQLDINISDYFNYGTIQNELGM